MLRPPLAELSLALVGDAKMSALHEQFMGIAGPTDVLTFPLDEDARGRVTAGEVVVCVPEARRRAKTEGTDLRREALLYALHGMLHLCGYDDRTPADFARMHRAEDRILAQIGVGAVFGAVEANPAKEGTAGGGTGGRSKPEHPQEMRPSLPRTKLGGARGKKVLGPKSGSGDARRAAAVVQSRPPARRGARAPADRPKR